MATEKPKATDDKVTDDKVTDAEKATTQKPLEKTPDVFTEGEAPKSPTRLEKGKGDVGQEEVQAKVDEAEAKGYIGVKTDPEPNESYTVQGVTSKSQTS